MKVELEYNARSIPASEIAQSFIPPATHFSRLLSRNHTLLLGPRGSGKTTLLKMLTLPALASWVHPQAKELASQVTFNAAFVPADIAWGKQLDAFSSLRFGSRKKEAAFVLHTLRALIHAMRVAVEVRPHLKQEHLVHLTAQITPKAEEEFVKITAANLGVQPQLNTLLGLELALEVRLNSISSGDDDDAFSVESFPSKLSLVVSAFNGFVGDDHRRWALLFDELEIAPTSIKSFLLSGIRSFDERIIVKLALAPYMDDAGFERNPIAPQPLHDYQTIQLTYANKDDAASFSSELFLRTLNRLGVEIDSLEFLFQFPEGFPQFGRRPTSRRRKGQLPNEFHTLALKDESFRRYAEERGLFSPSYKFDERHVAQDIRKVLPIVTARNFYLRKFEGQHAVTNRSRKSSSLYAGYPSIVEITEGNPRAILTCVGPLAQEYRRELEKTDSFVPVSRALQTSAINRVEFLLTSLLQVIPLELGGFEPGKGLLDFVDQIGRAFEDRLLGRPFSTDYVGTFILDENVTHDAVNAVGRALNAGAIIHVPKPDSGPDALLRGIVGQRFRLSYALAPRYRLLLTLGDRISLSKILLEMRQIDISNPQQDLF